jgi:hypothetical protein
VNVVDLATLPTRLEDNFCLHSLALAVSWPLSPSTPEFNNSCISLTIVISFASANTAILVCWNNNAISHGHLLRNVLDGWTYLSRTAPRSPSPGQARDGCQYNTSLVDSEMSSQVKGVPAVRKSLRNENRFYIRSCNLSSRATPEDADQLL